MKCDNTLSNLLDFLRHLDKAKIAFSLRQIRDDSIMVQVRVPGERWEIEFMEDGSVEVEQFKSDGTILGEGAIAELFQRFSE